MRLAHAVRPRFALLRWQDATGRPVVGTARVGAGPVLLALAWLLIGCTVPDASGRIWVTIPDGAPLAEVAESLATHGIITSPDAFEIYVRMTRKADSIRGGVYRLRRGLPVAVAAAELLEGRPPMRSVVVPEGVMLRELAAMVEQEVGIDAAAFVEAAADSSLRVRVGARGQTLEGYLYPTLYYVRVGATAGELVHQMVDEFEAHWEPAWTLRLDSLALTRDEVVTLASIIEGEIIHDTDRRYVSSVYHNRLAAGMRLQADPTVVYALGERRRLYHRDYQLSSEYNTYRVDGLPPGPIAQPSRASLEAALYPASTDFYYFVAGADGKHVFSSTYRQHLATIRRVRRRGALTQGARG